MLLTLFYFLLSISTIAHLVILHIQIHWHVCCIPYQLAHIVLILNSFVNMFYFRVHSQQLIIENEDKVKLYVN
jgi:hypothetical protein